jgi:hypothetical protein
MSAKRTFTTLVLAATLAAYPAAAVEPEIADGEELEARVDGDLNGDGTADLAYIVRADDWRELRVVLSYQSEVDFGFEPAEALDLDPYPLGPASLSLDGNVLKVEDLTGGTTAYATTRRFRHDGSRKRMRLIGMDVKLYSRTYAHDGAETSWNLLTGDANAHDLRLNRGDGEQAYDVVRQRSFKRRVRPIWLADSPDPETLLEEMRDG